jgi:predicted phosphodiesterase
MKFGIFGDIDSNLEALEAVLEDMQAQSVVHTVCTGDIVGKYANPRECLEVVRAMGCPIVKGNHDERASESGKVNRLNNRKSSAIHHSRQELNREQREFLSALPLQRLVNSFEVTHSTLEPSNRWGYVLTSLEAEGSFQLQETNICFFGHTRMPHVFIRDTEVHKFFYKKIGIQPDKKYFINVGSVGQPRDGDWRAAYVIYDSDANTIELRRLPFDIGKAEAKLRNKGLL